MSMENLSDDVKAGLLGCGSAEELHELAKASGHELSDEQLMGLSGGTIIPCHDKKPRVPSVEVCPRLFIPCHNLNPNVPNVEACPPLWW